MQIILSQTSKEPLYAQIVAQLKKQILKGILQEGDTLPSIRTLAKDLHVSVITTKRAYEELEREGLIFSLVGKGSFVAGQQPHILKEWQLRAFENELERLVLDGKRLGISKEEMKTMISIYLEDGETT